MQRLIKEWGKDEVVNVAQRANLYKTIKRLNDADLIAVRQTERDQQYPERTVYELTATGRAIATTWLFDMLATPRNEFPEFPAALSFAMMLNPEETLGALDERAGVLRDRLAAVDRQLETNAATLPKIALLDNEYQRAMTAAELRWLKGVVDDLRSGALTWSDDLADLTKS
jgi:DNA-binding PadR family transcriptional regulator